MPTTDLLVVSCQKHFPWLRYCLISCKRFATGFRQVKVLIPSEDLSAMTPLLTELSTMSGIDILVQCYADWPGKGFLRHEHVIMCSDEFTDADFVCHIDSDCMFVEPVTPETYFVDGKPVLMHGRYEWLKNDVQANLDMWRLPCEEALGWSVEHEFMRRHPAVHPRKLYPKTREIIEAKTRKPLADYYREGRDEFPQDRVEFPILGAVAWELFHDDYCWIDHENLHKTNTAWPRNPIVQWWSRGAVEVPQAPVLPNGEKFHGTPDQLLKAL